MSRIDEIQARLDEALKVRPYEEQDRDEHKSKAWSDFYQHAPDDIAWLLDALARRDRGEGDAHRPERCPTCGCELAYPTAVHVVDCGEGSE